MANLTVSGNITTTFGTVTGALLTGYVTTNNQPNITALGNLTGLRVGNATVYVLANSNGTFSATGPATVNTLYSNGTITGDSFTSNSTIIANGAITSNADINAFAGYVNANILSANYLYGNGYYLTGITANVSLPVANGTSNLDIPVANGNITFGSAGNANILIISGIGANVNGKLTVTNNVAMTGSNISLGNVANLHITGGTSGQVIQTDGAGNLSFVAQSGGGSSSTGYEQIFLMMGA